MVQSVLNETYETKNAWMRRTARIFLVFVCMCLVCISAEIKTDGAATANGYEDNRSSGIYKMTFLHNLRSPEINIIYSSVFSPKEATCLPRVCVRKTFWLMMLAE
jgi:hypothetical protein